MLHLHIALTVLDHAAVFVFAATGALAAARRQHDIVTFFFFAAITGVGGGTLRDLLMGAPVFWVQRPEYLVTCLVAAAAIWILGGGTFRERILIWLDALGLSAYSVMGAAKALTFGLSPVTAIVMGVLTATFGGVIRDVLDHQESVLLRREIYVTAALAGSVVFVALMLLHVQSAIAGAAGFTAALGLRSIAILYGASLPSFRSRVDAPPRN